MNFNNLDVGIVHDWFPVIGGAERVVEQLTVIFPNTKIYTLFNFLTTEERLELLRETEIEVSSLNTLPFVRAYYRFLLLECMRVVEGFDVTKHDVVISSSASIAKGVITAPGQPHIAYIHSPARYAWDLTHEYIGGISGYLGPLKRVLARRMMHKFRMWDMRTTPSIDLMLANSKFIQRRIRKTYGRESIVVYPPVNTDSFTLNTNSRDDFFLTTSRLVPYKRIDLIVRAFASRPQSRLVVIGDGPTMKLIKSIATPNVEIIGYQSFETLREYMQKAKAFVFAAKEDFGIVPVEAQACGTPVIALGFGGTAETIRPLGLSENPTGVWFGEQTVESLNSAIDEFEKNQDRFDPENCRKNALSFGSKRFRGEVSEIVEAGFSHGFGIDCIQEKRKKTYSA